MIRFMNVIYLIPIVEDASGVMSRRMKYGRLLCIKNWEKYGCKKLCRCFCRHFIGITG
jgi:hypothetical protein